MAKKMRKCFKRIVEPVVNKPIKREDVGSDEWYRIKGEVEWNPNVTAEELNHFLSLRTYYDDYLAIGSLEAMLNGKKPDDKLTITKLAYRQKARAFAQEVNLHEQNIAPADLYKVGNPAWAKGLSTINSEISMLIIGPPRKKGFWTSLNNISVSCSPARTTIGLEKRSFSLLCWETNDLPNTRKVFNGALPHTPISF